MIYDLNMGLIERLNYELIMRHGGRSKKMSYFLGDFWMYIQRHFFTF